VDIVHREIDRYVHQSSGPEDPTLREIEGFAAGSAHRPEEVAS